MNTAKRSAASRKAWRTRKRMAAARRESVIRKVIKHFEHYSLPTADDITPPDRWPEYKRRALPLPEFGK